MIGNASYLVEPESLTESADPGGPVRPTVRITAVYATPWLVAAGAPKRLPSADLALGPLVGGYDDAAAALPTIVSHEEHRPAALRATGWKSDKRVAGITSLLFALPSKRIVTAIRLDLAADLAELPPLLDELDLCLVQIGGQTLNQLFAAQAGVTGNVSAERHIVTSCWTDGGPNPADAAVHPLLYPSAQASRREDASAQRPAELNVTGSAWVSPYATVTAGHPEDVDNAILLSAVVAVASAASLREIRATADEALRSLTLADTPQRVARGRVEEQLEQLAQLETELGLAVDSAAEIGTLIPSRAIDGYHRALFSALDIGGRSVAVGRLLHRLNRALSAKLAASMSAEQRHEQRSRDRWSAAFWLILAVGLPAAIALGYAGRDEYTADDVSTYVVGAVVAAGLVLIYALTTMTQRGKQRG